MIALLIVSMGLGILFLSIMFLRAIAAVIRRKREMEAAEALYGPATLVTVEIESRDAIIYQCTPCGPPCRLEECPRGPFIFRGELWLKTDHGIAVDIYGEAHTVLARGTLVVQPVSVKTLDPDPLWIDDK